MSQTPRRVWFNRTFSSIRNVLDLLRQGDASRQYRLLASSPHAQAPVFLAADECAVEPPGLDSAAYVDWCLAFCDSQGVDLFVPGHEARAIAAGHARFAAAGVRLLSVASPETLDLLHDKARFYQATAQRRVPPPEFRIVCDPASFSEAWQELRPRHRQLCIKPAVSVFGLGFRVIDDRRTALDHIISGAEYRVGLDDLRQGMTRTSGFRPLLLMEHLGGAEYSVDAVADAGRLVCAIPRRKPTDGRPGQTIDPRPDVVGATAELCRDFALNGLINVQFRDGEQGLRLLEINPRPSGGIGMACLAGPNLPWLAVHGCDCGFAGLPIPALQAGLRVGEIHQPVVLP